MAEQTKAEGLEFAETFIGECIAGTCDRPATVRVYEDFVLCALHHAMHEAGQDIDEAGIGLELLAGWLSVATVHGNGYLQGLLGYAKDELLERKEWADRRMDQLKQVEHENLGNDKIRLQMGKKRRECEEERHNAPATPQAEERLRELLNRCDALSNAYGAVLEEVAVDAEMKAKTLATLKEMKEEANETFRRYKQEVGISSPTA